jgi:hypothetical protein
VNVFLRIRLENKNKVEDIHSLEVLTKSGQGSGS